MTRTIQPLTWTAVTTTGNTEKTEAEENIRGLLSVCDSLNTLCEKLSRLDYVMKRKIMEISLRNH